MVHPQALIKLFGYNAELITKQAAGITNDESLRVLPFAPHSFNWMLGHIVSARTMALQLVGEQPVWSDTERAPYRFGSAAEVGTDMPLADVLAAFGAAQTRLVRSLERSSYDAMCQPSGYAQNTVGDSLAYLQFHEAQHVGQLLYIAQWLRKQDVWLDS